jgi:hypothetical protein
MLKHPNDMAVVLYEINDQSVYVSRGLSEDEKQSVQSIIPEFFCATALDFCKECYMYKKRPTLVSPTNDPTFEYVYQCVTCEDGFFPDFSTGQCLQCNSGSTSCRSCAQYTRTGNFTELLTTYPKLYDRAKDELISDDEIFVAPQCYECMDGY